MRRNLRNRSGQAMIEYILMTLMIVSVIVGVLAGVLKPYLDAMQANIEERASTVVAQDRLGIPLEWFLGEARSFNDVDRKLGEAGKSVGDEAGGDGSAGADAGKNAGSSGSGKDAGGNGPGGRGGRGRRGGDGESAGIGGTQGSDKGLGRGGSGRGGGEEAGGGDSGSKKGKKGSGPDTGSVESSETKTAEVQAEEAKAAAEESGSKKKEEDEEGTGGGGVRGPKKDFGREGETRQGKGCAEMDMFTLVKLGALLALLLLGAAVVVTAKGQKGD